MDHRCFPERACARDEMTTQRSIPLKKKKKKGTQVHEYQRPHAGTDIDHDSLPSGETEPCQSLQSGILELRIGVKN